MTRLPHDVTHQVRSSTRLPDWASRGVLAFRQLDRTGVLDDLVDRIRIQREGGFSGFDVFVFLLYFFAAGATSGLRPFGAQVGDWGPKLAAVVGRASLPTPASVSRALARVTDADIRSLSFQLLVHATGVLEVMRHPTTCARDATGAAWHVFHKDGTRKMYRQRALPRATDEIPEPRRRTNEAAPGYSGRKRGQVQMHRLVLQHAGSSAWLMSEVAPGNGCHDEELELALRTLRETIDLLGHPVDRSVICMDGEDGWVPSFHRCIRHNVPFVTRLNRPQLLDQPEVRRRMREADWFVVPDSGSGPQRAAMDLGRVTVRAGKTTRDSDGSEYDPVEIRVVISRFHQPDSDRGRGRKVGTTRYELYATTLEPTAWPAAEVVHLYYGRTAQENRFLQEDHELGLDRTFSYHLPGQSFATLVGLMLWNLELVMGFQAKPMPASENAVAHRVLQAATPSLIEEIAVPAADNEDREPENTRLVELKERERELLERVSQFPIAEKLPTTWSWEPDVGVICPNGLPLSLSGVSHARPALIFRQKGSNCSTCPTRSRCLTSANMAKAKEHHIGVEHGPLLEEIRALLREIQPLRRLARSTRSIQASKRRTELAPAVTLVSRDVSTPPRRGCASAAFLPANARREAKIAAVDVEVFVRVPSLPRRRKPHSYVLLTDTARQHRRQSWAERQHRNDLPDGVRVNMAIGWPSRHPGLDMVAPNSI